MVFNNKFYSGKDEKYGVTIEKGDYILKPAKDGSGSAKIMSEFAASIVYKQLNIPVQNVMLTTWNKCPAVLIKDFLPLEHYFVPFAALIEENFDKGGDTFYSYENIRYTLLTHKSIENGKEALKAFWDMFLVDFLIGSGGRNASNWGFIGHRGKLSPAPVFDSASSFYYKDYSINGFVPPGNAIPPRMTFNGKICERIDVIGSFEYRECTDSALYVMERFSEECVLEALIRGGMEKAIATNWFIEILKYNYQRLEELMKR